MRRPDFFFRRFLSDARDIGVLNLPYWTKVEAFDKCAEIKKVIQVEVGGVKILPGVRPSTKASECREHKIIENRLAGRAETRDDKDIRANRPLKIQNPPHIRFCTGLAGRKRHFDRDDSVYQQYSWAEFPCCSAHCLNLTTDFFAEFVAHLPCHPNHMHVRRFSPRQISDELVRLVQRTKMVSVSFCGRHVSRIVDYVLAESPPPF